LTDLGNPGACFVSGVKIVFMENRESNDLRHVTKCGHDAAAYLSAILLYRDNGGAATYDTAKRYMRRVIGGGSTISRWLRNEGCLPLRRRPRVQSTPRCGAFSVNPCCLRHRHCDQPCVCNGGGYSVDKGWLGISLFCGETCRLRREMIKFEQSIGIGNH
jgi:hypothetical protein